MRPYLAATTYPVFFLVGFALFISVQGQSPPRITNNFSRIPVADQEDLHLTCTGGSSSIPDKTWRKDGVILFQNQSISIVYEQTSSGVTTSSLTWRKVPLEASGVYTCNITGVGEDAQEIYIMKAEAVSITVQQFSEANFSCTVFNWDLYDVPQFYKDDIPLDASSNPSYEQASTKSTIRRGISRGDVYSFRILNATLQDQGNYSCRVTVKFGGSSGDSLQLISNFSLTVLTRVDGGTSGQGPHITSFLMVSLISSVLGLLIVY